MPTARRALAAAALAVALVAAACASLSAGASREARLRRELDGYRLPRPVEDAWPAARRALADRGIQLVGEDRAAAGQPAHGGLAALLAKGYATRQRAGGGLVLESDADGSGLRYRLEGRPAGAGACQVVAYAVQGGTSAPSEDETRDLQLELEIIRRLDPDAAARILGAAEGR